MALVIFLSVLAALSSTFAYYASDPNPPPQGCGCNPYPPPNGSPPSGSPPNGSPPNGSPPNGSPPNGSPPSSPIPPGKCSFPPNETIINKNSTYKNFEGNYICSSKHQSFGGYEGLDTCGPYKEWSSCSGYFFTTIIIDRFYNLIIQTWGKYVYSRGYPYNYTKYPFAELQLGACAGPQLGGQGKCAVQGNYFDAAECSLSSQIREANSYPCNSSYLFTELTPDRARFVNERGKFYRCTSLHLAEQNFTAAAEYINAEPYDNGGNVTTELRSTLSLEPIYYEFKATCEIYSNTTARYISSCGVYGTDYV